LQQGPAVAQVPVHDRAGDPHAAHKGDLAAARLQQVLGDLEAAADVVALDAVPGDDVVVKIQKDEGQVVFQHGGEVAAVELAHEHPRVHAAPCQDQRQDAAVLRVGHDDLQHALVFQPVAVADQRPVEIGVEGVVPKMAVGHQDADVYAALRRRGFGRREIAHFLGRLQDLFAHFLADAVFAGQPFADGYDADPQLLCNIRHAHSL